MKKVLIVICGVLLCVSANAACEIESITYSCYAGYYLDGENCVRCPSSGGIYGTTVDGNTGDITSCYIPSGTTSSDTSGSFSYTADCHYVK